VKFLIISHVTHKIDENSIFAYAPYVREMNLWLRHVNEVEIVAPKVQGKPTAIDIEYIHKRLSVSKIPEIQFTSFKEVVNSILKLPLIISSIYRAMKRADHLHLRCPGNIGLLGCLVQICFPKKPKTAKYAGNWDPNAKQPLSYRFQKWLLSNTFLTKNMQVLVYGDWPGQTKNIKSFFTATYPKGKTGSNTPRTIAEPFRFIFVGSLSSGKRPLYAVKLLEALSQNGVDCSLDIYGEGVERSSVESYIHSNSLTEIIKLHGNQTSEIVEAAYKESHFLILPSKSEGWPKVVAEAMFWGSIPIVPRISCVPWMLGNGERGILIEMDFDQDVAYVLSLLSQPKELNELRTMAQTWSQNYTLDTFESEIIKLL
jgi:glycosyltransferase involved in cell wall biosynthesis